MAKKSKTNIGGEESRKDNVKWTEQMDVVLIDALMEQQINGNRVDGTFTTTAYNNVLKVCREELNLYLDKEHLKNRIKTLKNNFNTCHDLFKSLSGFAWNPTSKLFEAENEVWKTLIEAKPNAKKWRYTEINHYDKLYELFAKDRATGDGAVSAKEKKKQWEKESKISQFMDLENSDEVIMDYLDPEYAQVKSQAVQSARVKRKATVLDSIDKHVDSFQSSMTDVAGALREGNNIAEKMITVFERGHPRIYSEEEVYQELLSIEIPEEFELDAFLFLIKSASKMRAFFAVPKERRRDLVLKMMHTTTNET